MEKRNDVFLILRNYPLGGINLHDNYSFSQNWLFYVPVYVFFQDYFQTVGQFSIYDTKVRILDNNTVKLFLNSILKLHYS